MEAKKYGIWSRISKSWMRDLSDRVIAYDTINEAVAHQSFGPKAHFEHTEWIPAEIGVDGQPVLDPKDLEPPAWTRDRSHQAPF